MHLHARAGLYLALGELRTTAASFRSRCAHRAFHFSHANFVLGTNKLKKIQMLPTAFIIAIDEGTSSTRATLYDDLCTPLCSVQNTIELATPEPGFVEQDAAHIWRVTKQCLEQLVVKAKEQDLHLSKDNVLGIGLTNQRETTVVWNKRTGLPLCPAIVWSDTRTKDIVLESIEKNGGANCFREKTGLPISTYFSAVKFKWMYDHIPEVKQACDEGDCLFGTVDTWILWNLTGGTTGGLHITDVTNASRTLLCNIKDLKWDEELLKAFSVPASVLPEIKSSSEVYGAIALGDDFALNGVPLASAIGDQQASLVGQLCLETGSAKCTYGTGCFLLVNTGQAMVSSKSGLLTTVAYQIGHNSRPVYALEGSIPVAGSGVNWLRDNLGFFGPASEIETVAKSVESSSGVYFIPAFSGLFAPHWKIHARGVISGLTLHTTKAHICRAFLEATCFQVDDILKASTADSGVSLAQLNVDGGMSNSDFIMQLQSDILNIPVSRALDSETTSKGAAIMAGLATGLYKIENISELQTSGGRTFYPQISQRQREKMLKGWNRAFASLDDEDNQ